MRIDESNYRILNRVSELTGTDYDIRWFDAENIDGYIDDDKITSMLEDLICEVDRLQEELEDKDKYYRDNWKPVSIREQIGYSEEW